MRAALALALMVLCVPCVQATSPSYPEIRITIEPPEMAVNYSQYDKNLVFDGAVTVDNPSEVSLQINLWAPTTGWSAICSPGNFLMQNSGIQHFNMAVRIPSGAANRSMEFWVSAEARLGGQLVAGNQSNRVMVSVRERPPGASNDGPLTAGYEYDAQAGALQALLATVVISAVAGVAIYWMAKHRWKHRRAGP